MASRAGARTPYGFGSEVSLLGRFGWFTENSGKHVHPPRELRPSVRGLFDLHGNLFEWSTTGTGTMASTPSPIRWCQRGLVPRAPWRLLGPPSRSFAGRRTAARSSRRAVRRTSGFRLALSLSGVTPEAASVK